YAVTNVVRLPNATRISKADVDSKGNVKPIQTALDNVIALLSLTRPVTGVNVAALAKKEDMISIEARLAEDWNDNYDTNQRTETALAYGWGTTTPMASVASPFSQTTQIGFLQIDKCYERLVIGNSSPGLFNSRSNVTMTCTVPRFNRM
ncbi:serine protease, partial [Vibrio parahaemolyticus]